MANPPGAVRVRGLKELTRAFNNMNKDLGTDLIWEIQEAADPVRSLTEQLILGGGLGFSQMENMPPTPYYADMRIGASKAQGRVYIVPAWHRGTGAGTRRPNLVGSFTRRMEGALDDRSDEIVERVDDFLGDLGREWERYGGVI